MTCSPGCLHPRRHCRARKAPVSTRACGPMWSVEATGNPFASGHPANFPPHQWACAQAGSKGPKKNLIRLLPPQFCLPGTSPDIPVVLCAQFNCSATIFDEISAGLLVAHAAFYLPANGRMNFENYTVVASALVAESGRRARLKPGCSIRACRFKSCRAHMGVVGEIAHHSWLLPSGN